jgi:Zn-dependent protease with chaperone function
MSARDERKEDMSDVPDKRCLRLLRPLRIWAPYVLTVAGGGASLVTVGSSGVGGLTAAAGWHLAKVNVCATLGYTLVSAVRFGLFGGDGAQTARLFGGSPASSSSRIARAVKDVAQIITVEPTFNAPQPYIIPTDEPNAFAAGRGDTTIIAVSEGLLRRLDQNELCAVVAHELAHIQHADVTYHMQQAAMAAGFAGALDLGWNILTRPKRTSKTDEEEDSSSLVAGLALVAIGGAQYALGTMLRLATARGDEFAADRVAAQMPGGAQALARALTKIEKAARVEGVERDVLGHSGGALAALFIANDAQHDAPTSWSEWLATHPSTHRRIAHLQDIARARGEQFYLVE